MSDATVATDPGPGATTGWVCMGCRARVALDEDVCPACGRPFAAGLASQATEPKARRRAERRPGRGRAVAIGLRELIIVNLLFILWRVVGNLALLQAHGAFERGRWIWHAERVLHLPSEVGVQHAFVGSVAFIRGCDFYYEYAHIAGLVLFLIWLFCRHRDAYFRWRGIVVLYTSIGLLIEMVPVAPPRLLPGLGFVDTAARYHESVYPSLGKGISDQLASVPSMHVGWALLIAIGVVTVSRSRWRWLVVLHPVVTAMVVLVTANHWWLDAIAAVVLLAPVLVAVRFLPRWWRIVSTRVGVAAP